MGEGKRLPNGDGGQKATNRLFLPVWARAVGGASSATNTIDDLTTREV